MKKTYPKPIWTLLVWLLIASLCFSFLPEESVEAANPGWTQIGPQGGDFWEIVQNPFDHDIFFAYVTNGLFKSVDGGHSWVEVALPVCGTAQGNYVDMTIGGGPDGRLLLYICSNLYVSELDEIDWTMILENFGTPGYGDDIYMARNDPMKIVVLTNWEVKTSSDGGLTWQVRYGQAKSLGMKVDEPDKLLMGKDGGLYYSDDFGLSWTLLSTFGTGIISSPTFSLVDGSIYLYYGNTRSVLRSEDLGANWTAVKTNVIERNTIRLSEFNSKWILFGDSVTSDGGLNWQTLPVYPDQTIYWHERKLAFGESLHIFGGNSDNFAWMNPNGSIIFTSNQGVHKLSIGTVLVNPRNPDQIYGCTRYNLANGNRCYFTDDGGASWRRIDVAMQNILVSPLNFAHVYLIEDSYSSKDRIFKSLDFGQNLTQVGVTPSIYGCTKLQHNASLDGVLYGDCGFEFYHSVDSGATWSVFLDQSRGTLYADPFRQNALFLHHSPMLVTMDGGQTWVEKSIPGSSSSLESFIILGDENETILYLALDYGTWISRDDGTTWEQRSSYSFTDFAYANSFFKTENGIPVIVGSKAYNSRVVFSSDYGYSWTYAPVIDEVGVALGVGAPIPNGIRVFAGTYNYSILSYDVDFTLDETIFFPMISNQ